MGSSPLLPGMLADVSSASGLTETPFPQLSQNLFLCSLLQFSSMRRYYPFSRESFSRVFSELPGLPSSVVLGKPLVSK